MIENCFYFRYDFNNSVLKKLTYFQPQIVLSNECLVSLVSLIDEVPRISQHYTQSDLQQIDTEWRLLKVVELDDSVKSIKNVDDFWIYLYNWECDGYYKFKNVADFVLKILSLPHSSVDCERVFSKVNLIKTKVRNRLQVESLNGLLLSCEHIKCTTCVNFNPTKAMIDSINITMYTKDTMDDNSNSQVEEFGNFTA